MNRKDTILIAVLVNAGLLAILFIAAVVYDTDTPIEQTEQVLAVADTNIRPQLTPGESEHTLVATQTMTVDEVDSALKFYEEPETDQPTPAETRPEPKVPEIKTSSISDTVEVTVKKGDSLDKLAKANNTTVSAIKKANALVNERLSIGQVLKIPIGKKKTAASASNEVAEAQYYVIKQGDNPWKIAKQFSVKYEDILKLNNMDEDKAKNLKAGDRIRIK